MTANNVDEIYRIDKPKGLGVAAASPQQASHDKQDRQNIPDRQTKGGAAAASTPATSLASTTQTHKQTHQEQLCV